MGLSSSKHNAPGPLSPSSSTGAVVRRIRSSRSSVLTSSCLRSHHSDNVDPKVSDCPSEENGKPVSCPSDNKSGPCQILAGCYKTEKAEWTDDENRIMSDIKLHGWGEPRFTNILSREGNTFSQAFSTRSWKPPFRVLSRFGFCPGNLSRSNSLDSARAYQASSTGVKISNDVEEHVIHSCGVVNRNDRPHVCDCFPGCFTNRSARMQHENCVSNNLKLNLSSPDVADSLQDNQQINSSNDLVSNRDNPGMDCSQNLFSSTNHINTDSAGIRHAERRIAPQEPLEWNARFSRTLSVGRLRDRVLRRTPGPDLDLYSFQQDREARHTSHINVRPGLGHAAMGAASDDNHSTRMVSSDNFPSSMPISFCGGHNDEYETPRARATRHRDVLEYRSNFLERRRRIRSQVRALQRLGSRFESLSRHERSCILSGQNQAGHCTRHIAAREVNSNDQATPGASISRIVMLAEALFEVLDEIHQQSAVVSSWPSVFSIGSVPAPNEVVDSLPLMMFSKLKRKPSEEAAQCYICLVEYEEGDSLRILPCHHQFHRACVDKWLKEIHRVCPLCRGDVCVPDFLSAGS